MGISVYQANQPSFWKTGNLNLSSLISPALSIVVDRSSGYSKIVEN